MGVVNDSIEDGVSQGGIFQVLMPQINGNLSDQDAGASLPAVIKDLEEMTNLIGLEGITEPVVDDQERGLGQPVQQLSPGPVDQGAFDFIEQPLAAEVAHREPVFTGASTQGRAQITFPYSRRAGDDDVLVMTQPVTLSQRHERASLQPSIGSGQDFCQSRFLPEPGLLDPAVELPCFSEVHFMVDQKTESFFKAELHVLRVLSLQHQRFTYSGEAQAVELIEQGFSWHWRLPVPDNTDSRAHWHAGARPFPLRIHPDAVQVGHSHGQAYA